MNDGALATRQVLGWLWRDHLKARLPMFAAALLFMALEGASVGALSYLVRPMFEDIHAGADMSIVWWVALAVAAVFVARALSGFAQRVILRQPAQPHHLHRARQGGA